MIITAINNVDPTLGIIPWVIKNPYNITSNIDSTKEKEVRMLYSPYYLGEVNSGIIEMNIKERLGYKGIAKSYADFALKVSKVIFGNKCNSQLADELKAYLTLNGIEYTCL